MDRTLVFSETVLSERKLSETGRPEPIRRKAELEKKRLKEETESTRAPWKGP